jgi:hypothetical protein
MMMCKSCADNWEHSDKNWSKTIEDKEAAKHKSRGPYRKSSSKMKKI